MSNNNNKIWWEVPPEERHQSIFAVFEQILQNSAGRILQYTDHATQYSNREINSFDPSAAAETRWDPNDRNTVSYNVVKVCIDALTSKITKNKPKVYFLTDDGSFDQQERAKGLNRYIAGCFHFEKAYGSGAVAFEDACIYGTGVLKIHYSDKKKAIKIERVKISDVFVDEFEGESPQQVHERRWVDRYQLAKLFPEHAEAIGAAEQDAGHTATMSDRLEVVESWYAPADGSEGRHCISIRAVALLDEPWKLSLPFVFIHYNRSPIGFYGTGLSFELSGNQKIINQTLETIVIGQKLMCVPRYLMAANTTIKEEDAFFSNEIGQVVRYEGVKPEQETGIAFNPEIYNFNENLYRKCFELTGVSLTTATSKIPAGLESGVALMAHQDIETERFATTAESYAEMYVQLAQKIIEFSKFHFSKKTKVIQKDDRFSSSAFWQDIDLEEDKFAIQAWSTSILADSPPGKLQQLTDLVKGGMIEPQHALELLDFPDLRKGISTEIISRRLAEKLCNEILVHGKYMPPNKYMQLEIHAQVGINAYEAARLDDEQDPQNLELLLQYLDEIAALKAPPPAPPPMPPIAGAPPMDPGMPPLPPMPMDPGALPPLPPEALPPDALPPEGMPPQ